MMVKNRLEAIFQSTGTAEQFFEKYCKYLSELSDNLDYKTIEKVTQLVLEKSKSGQIIFLIGNGGSAATASHFAIDLAQCSQPGAGLYFRAVSLTDNVPLLTALGNDKGYEEIFTGQIENLLRKNDVLIAISASGNSPNIIAAARLAKELGGVTVGLVGFDGGKLAQICDYVIHVPTDKGEYGPVEDIHLILDHMITSYLRMKLGET
jgi:D-sedoheptulose 7-phosphate isomerase